METPCFGLIHVEFPHEHLMKTLPTPCLAFFSTILVDSLLKSPCFPVYCTNLAWLSLSYKSITFYNLTSITYVQQYPPLAHMETPQDII